MLKLSSTSFFFSKALAKYNVDTVFALLLIILLLIIRTIIIIIIETQIVHILIILIWYRSVYLKMVLSLDEYGKISAPDSLPLFHCYNSIDPFMDAYGVLLNPVIL